MKYFTKITRTCYLTAGLSALLVFISNTAAFTQDSNGDSLNVYEMSLEELLNMTITTASKSDEKVSEAPGVVSVITHDELNRFGGNTLYDILLRVPGLSPVGIYMSDRADVAARGDQVGGSASHILLLINGRPVREAIEGGIKSEMMKAFPVDIIDHIEVIRGPGSVLYGSNAFSAVINVITIKAEENTFGITDVIGNNGTQGTNGKIVFTDENHDRSLVIGGRYQTKNKWNTMILDTNAVTIPDEALGGYGEVRYKNFTGMVSYDQWENFYGMPHRIPAFPHPYGTAKWKKIFADAGYSKSFNERLTIQINTTFSQSLFEVDHFPSTTRNSKDFTAEVTGFYNPSEKIRIIAGGLYNFVTGIEKSTITDIATTDSSKNSGAGYFQADWKINDAFKIIAGLQANKSEGIKIDLNPRVGVIISPIARLNFKLLYAQAFRAPSLNENYMDAATLQGNNNLEPEKVHNIDLGINYMGEKLQAGLNGFYMIQKNIIVQTGTSFPREYNNVGEVTIYGIELEGKAYLNKDIFASLSMLYQQSKDTSGTENVTPVPNVGFKTGLSYMSNNGLAISLFNIYQGKVDDMYNNAKNPEAKAYDMLNAFASYDFQKLLKISEVQKLLLYLEFENILDQEIWLPATGITPLGYTLPFNQGLSVRAGLTIEF
jgi:outer membrane receptor for ferrienterochelin and colicins